MAISSVPEKKNEEQHDIHHDQTKQRIGIACDRCDKNQNQQYQNTYKNGRVFIVSFGFLLFFFVLPPDDVFLDRNAL